MGSNLHKSTIPKIVAILNLLKVNGEMHIRGLAKKIGAKSPFTVTHILENYLDFFVDIKEVEVYGFKAKLVRLKPGKENTTIEDVLRYYWTKKRIKGNV
mgnify:CR=1 FL=1